MSKELTIPNAGNLIREKRKDAALTLEQLSDLTGIHLSLLSKYETNDVALSKSVIDKIAAALNERPEALACELLRVAYPALAKPRTKGARLLAELIDYLSPGSST